MEFEEKELEPVSPIAQYLKSSVLSLSIIAVLEFEVPINDLPALQMARDILLAINPRFSSIMVEEKKGEKKWKRVDVKLEDHVKTPIFPNGKSPEFYDECLHEYLSKIAIEQLPQSRPMWEIHVINYKTSNAAAAAILKLHHSLGDGYSLMGALLSCLQRADNPCLPLTFPSRQSSNKSDADANGIFKSVPRFISRVYDTVWDFGWSLLQSSVLEDDCTPIRSGDDGMEFRPMAVTSMTFSLDQIKIIKSKLKVTVNDVVSGTVMFGCRLYMQDENPKSATANATALVLLNTRNTGGYKSISEMLKPNAEMPWGNHFAFLHVSIPKLTTAESSNPLNFVLKAHRVIKRKRNSAAVFLTGRLIETLRKLRGSEATARFICNTLRNSSVGITNLIGPEERMALGNHPVSGLYFTVAGSPQSLVVAIVSYLGKLTICLGVEKGFIDSQKLKTCIENAFEMMIKAAA